MKTDQPGPVEPPTAAMCRRKAAELLQDPHAAPEEATAWALLAVAGELKDIRRLLERRR
ncbi:hypothetical protein HHL19_36400 [Streptomyces sp. R302]|uniref:hypothetical protein n=1 Tax=unclassified Streptomyces TaxID=2593676 RepID=UPI00145C60FD|nr:MULTISPECIES: hypothetical protein [unclassified Streptomyces]NML55665.1 hypothetical protein [Streptomyces sp. R301]NML83993.1 hypothetical protein [Streptomyces sp. R302]